MLKKIPRRALAHRCHTATSPCPCLCDINRTVLFTGCEAKNVVRAVKREQAAARAFCQSAADQEEEE
jgi:hypothetical protein